MVVFAGAGISMPASSNYPDFAGLATKVGSDVLTQEQHEPIDRFLGRLYDKGVNVHSLVATMLANPDSRPNSLHFDLLKLFQSPASVRLVTTNFDVHFTSAITSVFGSGEQCEIYSAPALPLGHSFSGIVYLHGNVEKPPERLVLTDRDFGRAYLTEGWARIFLQRLFGHFTVLFVGYSHNDPVMTYLARGLPPQAGAPQRFALTPKGNEEHWRSMGITPIAYELSKDENSHSILSTAVGAWATQAQQGALDQEQRVRSIVALPPPLDVEDADYVKASLSREDTARYFTRYASTVEWLKWVEEAQFLTNLFRIDSSLTEVDKELALWFSESFVLNHAGEALSLVRRQGQQLHPGLWNSIAHRLFRHEPGRRHDPEVLRKWIPILINPPSSKVNLDLLAYILAAAKLPEDQVLAIALFEFLTRPVVRLEKNLWHEIETTGRSEDVTTEIETLGDEFWMKHAWQKVFHPHLPVVIDAIEPIVTSHIQQAFFLSRIDSEPAIDNLSLARGQIENSAQGGLRNGIGVLIDTAYELMKWNATNRIDRADSLVHQWFSSPSSILKRLAVIGVAENSHWPPDRKISWLLENDLLYAIGFKHEVFELLKNAYPLCVDSMKEAVIAEVKEGRPQGVELSDDIASYERYNLLNWLNTIAPSSSITKKEFDAMQESHPSFRKRTRPDLDVVFDSWSWGKPSPITVDDLLAKSPVERIDWLVDFKPDHPLGPNREGLVEAVREASSRNYEWGMSLACELAMRNLWDSDLWFGVVRAWGPTSLNGSQWQDVLNLLATNPSMLSKLQRDIATLLSEGTKGTSPAIPDKALGLAINVSKMLWSVCAKDVAPERNFSEEDWLLTAINHPGGMLALFWLNVLSKQRRDSGETWVGLQAETRQVLEDIVSDESYAADLAKVVFASQLAFLFALDEQWTKQHVLPLFDWSISDRRAVQALHGFLGWGRQTEALVPYLVPLYVKIFPHMAALGKSRSRFSEYLAGLACFGSINPVKNGWLNQFLSNAELQDRIEWAGYVCQMLKGMKDESRKALWDSWMCEYWERRLLGVPMPFVPEELGEMVKWSLHLGAAFPSVVEKIVHGPCFRLEHSFIYRELDETEIPENYSSQTAELLLVLLRNETDVKYDLDRAEAIIRRVAPLNVARQTMLAICDELARLGDPNAGSLRDFVQGLPQR